MADWFMMAVIHAVIGYEALGLGFVGGTSSEDANALLITAFLVYTTAVILLSLSYFGDIKGMAVDVSTIVLIFLAGTFAVIGVIIWDDGTDAIRGCLDVTGALMALLAGIFLSLKIAGVGPPSAGNSSGGKQYQTRNKTTPA